MAGFSFAIDAEACDRLYDALVCLAKFSDFVTIEAEEDQLALSALNASRSGYLRILLHRNHFCLDYSYNQGPGRQDRLAYRILNKALLSVFKWKSNDQKRNVAVERCIVSAVEESELAASRLWIQFHCSDGIRKNFKLIYESVDSLHAAFDKRRASNAWKTKAKLLRETIEYFGPRTEQLDMYYEEGRFVFTSYTRKITNGKAPETLKQPLQTAVSVETLDFEEFDVVENLHIGISVKDFKNMVMHADSLQGTVSAIYSQSSRPLQFTYGGFGVLCELTLMTIGDTMGAEVPLNRTISATKQVASDQRGIGSPARSAASMPPPQQPASRSLPRPERPLGSRSSTVPRNELTANTDPDSLFIPPGDDEQSWEPSNFQDEEPDMLGWDASADNDMSFHSTFRDGQSHLLSINTRPVDDDGDIIAPTQRVSQIRGLFDS